MTFKMIAIGILALMGLSSVMNPKSFRIFLGGFGAICMALFFGFLATGDQGAMKGDMFLNIAKLQRLVGLRTNSWLESATNESRQIVSDINQGKSGDPDLKDLVLGSTQTPQPKAAKKVLVARKSIIIDTNYNEEDQRQQLIAGIQTRIDDFLEIYRQSNKDVGVDRLSHKNLDPKLLKWYVGTADGMKHVWLGFDETYFQHVRTKGRQLVVKERLKPLAFAGVACGAFLLLGYGVLKITNRNAEPVHDQDYLQNSSISMV